MDRPSGRRDRGHGLQDRGSCAHARRRRSGRAGNDGPCPKRRRRARCGRRDRLSGRDQGVRRWRWEGAARRPVARRRRACLRSRSARGRGVLRGLGRVRRAVPRRPAPRRGADPRGRSRQRHPSRRARLHHPAPPPEARRGDALARRRSGAACAHRRARGRGRTCGGVPLGRNDRRASHRGRRVLLPRDEHPRPGRAHGHGGGHRHRHRARAGARRRR